MLPTAGADAIAVATRSGHHHVAHYLENVLVGIEPRPSSQPYNLQVAQLDEALTAYIHNLTAALCSKNAATNTHFWTNIWEWNRLVGTAPHAVKQPTPQQLLPSLLQRQLLIADIRKQQRRSKPGICQRICRCWHRQHSGQQSSITNIKDDSGLGSSPGKTAAVAAVPAPAAAVAPNSNTVSTVHILDPSHLASQTHVAADSAIGVAAAIAGAESASALNIVDQVQEQPTLYSSRNHARMSSVFRDITSNAMGPSSAESDINHCNSLNVWHASALFQSQRQDTGGFVGCNNPNGQLSFAEQLTVKSSGLQHEGAFDLHSSVIREASSEPEGVHSNSHMHNETSSSPISNTHRSADQSMGPTHIASRLQMLQPVPFTAALPADRTVETGARNSSQAGPMGEGIEEPLVQSAVQASSRTVPGIGPVDDSSVQQALVAVTASSHRAELRIAVSDQGQHEEQQGGQSQSTDEARRAAAEELAQLGVPRGSTTQDQQYLSLQRPPVSVLSAGALLQQAVELLTEQQQQPGAVQHLLGNTMPQQQPQTQQDQQQQQNLGTLCSAVGAAAPTPGVSDMPSQRQGQQVEAATIQQQGQQTQQKWQHTQDATAATAQQTSISQQAAAVLQELLSDSSLRAFEGLGTQGGRLVRSAGRARPLIVTSLVSQMLRAAWSCTHAGVKTDMCCSCSSPPALACAQCHNTSAFSGMQKGVLKQS